jgi:predicted nucleotide-binding protein (sugar kinase/HSP70/actin superfamily)
VVRRRGLMAIKIGIPRGLWFYDYYPLWKTFYEHLGAQVILSEPTNKEILDQGVKNTVDEACLPVKIFNGHVIDLKDKVDYVFVPKMMSVYEKEYICPKFCGLSEMVSHSVRGLPPLIDVEINFNKSRKNLTDTIYKFGSYVTKNKAKIEIAYDMALKVYKNYKDTIKKGNLPIDGKFVKAKAETSDIKTEKTVAVVGHPYNVYDSYSSMNLLNKLKKNGVHIVVPGMIGFEHINRYAATLDKKMFWSFGRKLLGTSMYLAEARNIDGIIYVSSFGCGIDSIIQDLFERKSSKKGRIPFLLLTIDEHTGEAGINTRIEAFLDMIEWRKGHSVGTDDLVRSKVVGADDPVCPQIIGTGTLARSPIITFPHMGNQYIATKVLLEELGVDLIVPPQCSKETLNIGVKYSPESICLPLKVNMGNYIESINMGANTIVITGSCGPCRFGYYSIIQKELLNEAGYDIDVILLDPPQGDYKTFFDNIFKLTGTKNPYKILKALKRAIVVINAVDDLEETTYYKRPREKTKGTVDRYYDAFHKDVRTVYGYREVLQLIKDVKEKILSVEEDTAGEIIKIGIIGEIYTIIEPFVNLNIEKKLGGLGVEIEKSLKISRWLNEHLFLNPLGLTSEKKTRKAAEPYLRTMIGGHARETIGYAVRYAKEGFDGVIQIYPLTCMPEIVAQGILPSVEKDHNIPYLCLIVDEMTGEAGYMTRLEAFVDLLRRRKEINEGEKLLFGH